MNDIIQEVVNLCMINQNLQCKVNHETIVVLYNSGYNVISFESWHTEESMKEIDKFGYTPFSKLLEKIKDISE